MTPGRMGLLFAALLVAAGAAARANMASDLMDKPLSELMGIEVFLPSKHPEPLFEAASAIYVITHEDIQRSGATSIPEALRMVPGMQVAQGNSSQWAISARGFNNAFANKLLVLIDGRSVYTTLFGGVYWDVQDVLLEDIERIEVVRGPGASLWGANALNGVINIVTKRARDRQGGYIDAGGGSTERGFGDVRYGGRAGPGLYYGVYAKYFERGERDSASRLGVSDRWDVGRGGFQLDWSPGAQDGLLLQGDFYGGQAGQLLTLSSANAPFTHTLDEKRHLSGGNVLGRWTHAGADSASTTLQIYFDRTNREDSFLHERRNTLDLDLQRDLRLGTRHEIVGGVGYRYTGDAVSNSFVFSLVPDHRDDHLLSGFLQDRFTLMPKRLSLTVGTKLENNTYTGFEAQPSARLLWTPDKRQTVWGAVSRAVRTPTRVEDDVRLVLQVFPGQGDTLQYITLLGNRNVVSDELIAYELGYRVRATDRLLLDAASFYNHYGTLATIELGTSFLEIDPPPTHRIVPLRMDNKGFGESYGVEVAANLDVTPRWRLAGSYTRFRLQLHRDPSSRDGNAEFTEGNDARNQFHVRSALDLWRGLQLDAAWYYVDPLPAQAVPRNRRLDLRLGWRPVERLDLSLVGQNLLERRHRELGDLITTTHANDIERSLYGKAAWRF